MNKKLNVISVNYKDFIGATIKHMYTDETTKEDLWLDAEVVDVDLESENMNNPKFYILYKESGDEIIDFSDVSSDD